MYHPPPSRCHAAPSQPASRALRVKPAYWDDATRAIGRADPVMRRLIQGIPNVHITRRGDPFTTLARAIVGQQISVKAAQTIWERFTSAVEAGRDAGALGVGLDVERVARTRLPTLRRCGLSARKAEYLRDLARHFRTGALDPREWPELDDEALIARLTDVKGIGRWTAEMFLIFHELRADVFPVADIGVQKAVARHYNGDERMDEDSMRDIAAAWQPWRSVATWYLWRSLDPIPVEY
jgi:DNA-3-methyladenine glycosylase II